MFTKGLMQFDRVIHSPSISGFRRYEDLHPETHHTRNSGWIQAIMTLLLDGRGLTLSQLAVLPAQHLVSLALNVYSVPE